MIDNYRIDAPQNHFEERKKEVQEQYPDLFESKFPKLQIDIIFDKQYSSAEIAKQILARNIRFVFSCIGMKEQEKRLLEIFEHLPGDYPVVGL